MDEQNTKRINRVIDLAVKAGVLLLKSGAEVRRVEEVVVRIASVYGVKIDETCYSLTNGLFVSYSDEQGNSYTKVQQVPIGTSRFNHLIDVNQFARDVRENTPELSEAEKILDGIANKRDTSLLVKVCAAAVVSIFFCLMLLGGIPEAGLAGAIGGVTLLTAELLAKKFSKIVSNMGAGFVMAGLTCLATLLLGENQISPSVVIAGAMMPLVPGIAFANGVRDIGNTDYLSGVCRLVDAILVFISIAIGAAIWAWIFPTMNFLTLPENYREIMDNPVLQFLFAGMSVAAFAVIFQTPKKYLFACALSGAAGWIVYYLLFDKVNIVFATLISSLLIGLCSRIFSTTLKAPVTIFIVPGIIPTVPGAALLSAFYGLLTNEIMKGLAKGLTAFEILIGIVIGIAVINAIPQKVFKKLQK